MVYVDEYPEDFYDEAWNLVHEDDIIPVSERECAFKVDIQYFNNIAQMTLIDGLSSSLCLLISVFNDLA